MTETQKTQIKGEVKLPSAQELLEAGVHFGHRTSRWHPKMEQYIFSSKNGIHIFDLEKTLKKLEEAVLFLQDVMSRGGMILFVGTKPAAKGIVQEIAQALDMPYVVKRWLGGTLTNYKTIRKRLDYYLGLEEQERTGGWDKYIKKERTQLKQTLDKLQGQLEGIKKLSRLPQALFVADIKEDNIAVREARKIGIPVVAICDTCIDPTSADYIIPANDDAASSIRKIVEVLTDNLKDIKPVEIISEKTEPEAKR